jgi:hypothetical protein
MAGGCSTFINFLFDPTGRFGASNLADKRLFALLPGLIALFVSFIVGLLLGLLVMIVQIPARYPGGCSDSDIPAHPPSTRLMTKKITIDSFFMTYSFL